MQIFERTEAALREFGRLGELEAQKEAAARRVVTASAASEAQTAKAVEAEQVCAGQCEALVRRGQGSSIKAVALPELSRWELGPTFGRGQAVENRVNS